MPSATSRGLLTVDLRALKPEVERNAAAAGERPSTWLRKLVERELGGPEPRQRASASPSTDAGSSALVKTTLRLEASVLSRLAEHAAREGVTRARWIERRVLNQTTTALTPEGLEALTRSTYALTGLSRHMSEIARCLNRSPALTTRVERQAIARAIELALAHVDMASNFVAILAPAQRPRRKPESKTA